MNKKNSVPKIRFKDFEDNWKSRKLSEISDKVTEKNKDNIYIETLTNSAVLGIISQRDYFDKDISNAKNLNGYYVVKPNDFVYNPRISKFAPVGPIKRNNLERTGVMSPLYYVFRTNNINGAFLERYFSSNWWHRFMKINGDSGARSDRFAIKDSVFCEMLIPYPSIKEQNKISALFEKIDKTVMNHQQLLNDHKQLKKAMLQKMFPQKGESVPRVRFAGFTDDWKKERLGKIIVSHSFKKYISEPIENGKYPIIQQGNNSIVGYSNDAPFIGFEDVTLFGDHTLSLYKPTSPFLVSTDGLKIISIDSFNGFFTYYLLEINNPESEGYKRHFKILKSKDVFYPDNSMEQAKIGKFLKQLDETIELHEQKLKNYQNFKKAMLQKMFV